jgi:hypothetical protein
MNLELLLLKLFLNNTALYFQYQKYLGTKYNNVYKRIYNALSELKKDGKPSHTVTELALCFHSCYPVVSGTEAELVEAIFSELNDVSVPDGGADILLRRLKQRHISSEIALAAVEVASGEGDYDTLLSRINELQSDSAAEEEENFFVSDDITEIQERLAAEPPFKFRLRTLNQILGGLRRRTFGFIYARPETGKTQLLASEGVWLAPQTKSCLLWINNEEDGIALVTRCYQAALLRDSAEIFRHSEKAKLDYYEKIQGKIKIYDKPTATAADIERIVRETEPDIIFIDQLDKLRGFKAERYDLEQKAKYQWARELAKRYNAAVVGICQAGGSAENKRFLDMNDVDSSHTAKQGEADWMFGLGRSDKVGEENRRFISVSKNKLPPVSGMVAEMRHAKVPILSVPELQIYEDALNVS